MRPPLAKPAPRRGPTEYLDANATGLEDLDPTVTPAREATHFRNIRAARANLEQAEADLRAPVKQARAAGDSWTTIGAALETTRQAAYQRFARDSREDCRR